MSYSRDPSASLSSSHVEMGMAPRQTTFASNPLASRSSSQVEMSSPRKIAAHHDHSANGNRVSSSDGQQNGHQHQHQHHASIWAKAAQDVSTTPRWVTDTPRGRVPVYPSAIAQKQPQALFSPRNHHEAAKTFPRGGQGQPQALFSPRNHHEAAETSPRGGQGQQPPLVTPRSRPEATPKSTPSGANGQPPSVQPRSFQESILSPRMPVKTPRSHQHSIGAQHGYSSAGTRHSFEDEAQSLRDSYSGGTNSQIMFGSPIRTSNDGRHITHTVGPVQTFIQGPSQPIQQIQAPYIIASSRGNMMF